MGEDAPVTKRKPGGQRKYATPEEAREAIRRRQAKDYEANRDKYRANARAWELAHPDHLLLKNAKGRAKRRGIPFNLTIEDVVIPAVCPVLGIPLEPNHQGGVSAPGSPTLDRLVPSRGYVKGNVVVMSYRANMLKNEASVEEAQRIAAWMAANVPA